MVTAYSGNSFPTYTPNPIFRQAYESGEVEVEHWSILTMAQRMEAAARGLPAIVTGSLAGSSMATNEGFTEHRFPVRDRSVCSAPLTPDVALVHAAAADRPGQPRLLRAAARRGVGGLGGPAGRRGHGGQGRRRLDGSGHRVRVPAHRVLAVVEAPFGAHPGGCYAPGLPVRSYGEDIAFWNLAAAAAKGDVRRSSPHEVGARADHAMMPICDQLGADHLAWLEGRRDPASWKATPTPPRCPTTRSHREWEHGGGVRRPRGRASGGRYRGRRRAGRRRRGQPGGMGGGGAGPGRREPRQA